MQEEFDISLAGQLQQMVRCAQAGLENGLKDRDLPHVPAFYCTRPKSICVADKPLPQGGRIRDITVDELEQRLHITWSTSPLIHKARKEKIYSNENCNIQHLNILYEHLYYQQPPLVICDINDRVGRGVFAKQQIERASFITIYTGLIDSSFVGEHTLKEYGYTCKDPIHLQADFCKWYGNAIYDAQDIRNYSSFFQHAPSKEVLAELNIRDEIKKGIVTANVGVFPHEHLGFPVLILMALRDIEPDEQLVFDYGSYWSMQEELKQGDGSYCLFDQKANIVGVVKGKEFVIQDGYDISAMSVTPSVTCVDYDLQMMLTFRERSVLKKVEQYLLENLTAITNNVPKDLRNKHAKIFLQLSSCIKKYQGVNLYNNLISIIKAVDIESIPELNLYTREIFMAMNCFIADFAERPKVAKVLLPGNVAKIEELIDWLQIKTGAQWKYSKTQQIFYTTTDHKQLMTIKSWFDEAKIKPNKSGRAATGDEYLCYNASDITLPNLAKLRTTYVAPSQVLKF